LERGLEVQNTRRTGVQRFPIKALARADASVPFSQQQAQIKPAGRRVLTRCIDNTIPSPF
jgi:hypothetical protein